jgi:hypothetical protein
VHRYSSSIGNAERIFPEYLTHLDFALEDFCDRHWPCEYVENGAEYPLLLQHFDSISASRNLRYLVKQSRCVNVRSGHGSKGHQTQKGKIFSKGEYVSGFAFEDFQEEFHAAVYYRLEHLMKLLDDRTRRGEPPDLAASTIHRAETLVLFYNNDEQKKARLFQSHLMCLSCLFNQPEHVLPCGHILCTACVRSYGVIKNATLVDIHDCPLESNIERRYKTGTIYLRPETTSPRVLVLDG